MSNRQDFGEPWAVGALRDTIIVSKDGAQILGATAREDDAFWDDIARIVACVNACKGISTEALQRPDLMMMISFRDRNTDIDVSHGEKQDG